MAKKDKYAKAKDTFDNAYNSLNDPASKASKQTQYDNMLKLYNKLSDEDKIACADKMTKLKAAVDKEKADAAAAAAAEKNKDNGSTPTPAPKPTTSVGGTVSTNNGNNTGDTNNSDVNNTETKADTFALTEEQMNNVNKARDEYLNKHSDRVSKKEEALSNANMSVFNREQKVTAAQKALNKQNASKDWYENNLYGKDLAAKKAERMEEDYRALNEYNNTLHNDDKVYGKNLSDAQKTRLQKRRNNGNELQKMADEAGLKYSSLVWDAVGNGLKSMSNAMAPLTGQKPFEDTQSPFSKRMNSRLAAASEGQSEIVKLENEAIEKARGLKLNDKGEMTVGNTPINLKDYMTNDMNFAALTTDGMVNVIKEILGTINLAGHSIDIDGLINSFTKRLNNGENAIDALWDLLKRVGTNISWGN